jgi:plastocyanin
VRRALLAAGVAALVAFPAATDAAKKPVKVQVGDDYFGPVSLKVAKGTTVAWKWLPVNGNTHDVKLKRGPKGKYFVICTFHENMTMHITVR